MGKKEDMKKYPIFKTIVEELKIKGNNDQLKKIADLITNEKKYLGNLSRDQKRSREKILKWFDFNSGEIEELIYQIKVIDNEFVLQKNDCQAAFQEENNKISLQEENSNLPIHDENDNSNNNNFDDINIMLSPSFSPTFSEDDYSYHPSGDPNSPFEYGFPDDLNSTNFGYDFFSQH